MKKVLVSSSCGMTLVKLHLEVRKCLQILLMTQMVYKTDRCFKSSMCLFSGHPQHHQT